MAEATGRVPQALISQPEVPIYLLDEYEAFGRLNRARAMGFSSPLPLALAELHAYCCLYQVEDVERFVWLMQELDVRYLNLLRERSRKQGNNGR